MPIEIKLLGLKGLKKELANKTDDIARLKLLTVKRQLVAKLVPATPIDTGEARAGWHTTITGIENNVEHIDALNAGHSRQAPKLFIERTVLSHRDVSPSGIIVRYK